MLRQHKVSIGLLPGIVAGVAAGIGARIAMRGVALVAGRPTGFTLAGTLGIIVLGVVVGTLVGLVFAVLRQILPVPGLWKGLVFGSLLFLVFALPGFLRAPEGELAIVPPLIGLSLFGPIFILYGIVLEAGAHWMEKRSAPLAEQTVDTATTVFFGAVFLGFLALYFLIVLVRAIIP